MGKPSTTERDLATALAQGSFTSATFGTPVLVQGEFNVSLWGTFVGTVLAERAFDGGAGLWLPLSFLDGGAITWTAPMSTIMPECEGGNLWRLRCSAFTSGTINWRISQ